MPDLGSARLIAYPKPFRDERVTGPIPSSWSVDEIVGALPIHPALIPSTRVWIWREGRPVVEEVPFESWRRVRPKPGATVLVKANPAGGGGRGGGGKSPVRIVASLAVLAVSSFAAPAILAASPGLAASLGNVGLALGLSAANAMRFATFAVGGAISFLGNALVNAIVPPSLPAARQATIGSAFSPAPLSPPTFAITGVRNQANPYGPIPRVFGRRRVFPALAARLYTETQGNDQYVRGLFCFGYGPLAIDDLRIGETPIAAFAGVETEVKQGYLTDAQTTLYSRSVREEPLNVLLTNAGGWQQRTTLIDTTEISVDVTCLRGLTRFNSSGGRDARSVAVAVEYRAFGSGGAWVPAGAIDVTDNSTSAVRGSLRWTVAKGQYDVRLMRTTADSTEAAVVDQCTWTALRSITSEHPIRIAGLALLALRIKANEQLNGVLDQVNAVVTSILPVWNGAAWTEQASRNPAWAFAEVARGRANKRPFADGDMDLVALKAWADAADAPSPQGDGPMWTYDAVHDGRSTVDAVLREIAAAGRARLDMPGGKLTVVRDVAQSVPWQHFTPRNSWGFKATRVYVERPHGLKCRFVNPEKGWQEDERIVYADGYSADGSGGLQAATLFEQLDLMSVTRPEQVWREARYHQAVAKLRPLTYRLWTDVENLACRLGDLVRVAYDVPRWGLSQARVASVAADGAGNVTGIVLDAAVAMASGKAYAVRIRRADNTSVYANVATDPGEQPALAPVPAILAASAPAAGDLVMFGEAGQESVACLVKAKAPGPELSAELVLIDAGPAVHDSYAGPIPAFQSQISVPVPRELKAPPRPAVIAVRSDESVLVTEADGSLSSRILLDLAPPLAGDAPAETIEAQVRASGAADWTAAGRFPAGASAVSIVPVVDGVAYDVRLRAISRLGVPSEWFLVTNHVVVGKTTPPPMPATVTLIGGMLYAPGYAPPRDLKGFRVSYKLGEDRVYGGAVPAHPEVAAVALPFDVSRLPGGTLTIFLTAVDTSGNESAPAVIVRDLGGPVRANVVETVDYRALAWPGTVAGGVLDGGDLAAQDLAPFVPAGDGAPFVPVADTAAFVPSDAAGSFAELVYVASFQPARKWLPAQLTLDRDLTGQAAIEFRTDTDTVFVPGDDGAPFVPAGDGELFIPTLGGWQAWPGAVDLLAQLYELRVAIAGGSVRGRLKTLKAVADVDDVEESFLDFAVAAGGTRLPLAKTYRTGVTDVGLTLLADGGLAVSARVRLDGQPPGPLIETLGAAGGAVGGRVNAQAKGY